MIVILVKIRICVFEVGSLEFGLGVGDSGKGNRGVRVKLSLDGLV